MSRSRLTCPTPPSEHLDRYHSLRFWCRDCKKRFRFNSQSDLDILKAEHRRRCTEQPKHEDEKEWARYVVMTSAQYSQWCGKKWKKVDIPRLEGEKTPQYSWRQIYFCLFADAAKTSVLSKCDT